VSRLAKLCVPTLVATGAARGIRVRLHKPLLNDRSRTDQGTGKVVILERRTVASSIEGIPEFYALHLDLRTRAPGEAARASRGLGAERRACRNPSLRDVWRDRAAFNRPARSGDSKGSWASTDCALRGKWMASH